MGFFDRWRTWTLEGVPRPWPASSVSLFSHLRSHTDPVSGKLSEAGLLLPDEPAGAPNQLRWAAGALDGVMGHHVGAGDDELRVKQLQKALVDVLTTATESNLAHLHRLVTRESVLGVIDPVLELLANNAQVRPERVHALGLVLASEAPEREAAKLGLALLGIVQGGEDEELLLQLGAHDELTLFAAVALVNRQDGQQALFRLAQRVDGWGRIQVVERLEGTKDLTIKRWMLREGFRNSVMDEYLAYTCAISGELHVALSAPSIDHDLLHGAAGLLAALARGGPAPGLSEYPHADAAISDFLRHLDRAELDLELIEALDALAASDAVSAPFLAPLQRARSSAEVRPLIEAGLASASAVDYGRATAAAYARGLDTFDAHERRVRAGDLNGALFNLMQTATEATIDRALAVAAPHLNLTAIATGPADSLGLGPEFAEHQRLLFMVQELARFPGRATELILTALRSPVVNNRHASLRALSAWTRARWPAEVAPALETAIAHEPLEDVKARMQRVLEGQPYDDEH